MSRDCTEHSVPNFHVDSLRWGSTPCSRKDFERHYETNVAGGRGFRTYRRACSAATEIEGVLRRAGPAGWRTPCEAHFSKRSPLKSIGAAIIANPHTVERFTVQ